MYVDVCVDMGMEDGYCGCVLIILSTIFRDLNYLNYGSMILDSDLRQYISRFSIDE